MSDFKSELLSDMRMAAMGFPEAQSLVDLLHARGREVALVEEHTPVQVLTREEYTQLLALKREQFARAGLAPPSYQEFLEMAAANPITSQWIPQVGEDWKVETDVAFIQVPLVLQEQILPGQTVALYAALVESVPSGERLLARAIYMTSVPCTPLWRGLAALIEMHILRDNLVQSEEEVSTTLRRRARRAPSSRQVLLYRRESMRFFSRLLDHRLNGAFSAMLNVSDRTSSSWVSQVVSLLETSDTELFPPARSELEAVFRRARIVLAIMACILTEEGFMTFLSHPGLMQSGHL